MVFQEVLKIIKQKSAEKSIFYKQRYGIVSLAVPLSHILLVIYLSVYLYTSVCMNV